MNENGNKYALAALKDRRALLAGEIAELKKQLMRREDQLEHLDATITLFQPDYDRRTIATKRPRRVKLFRQGELNRMILTALRRADKPLSTAEVVSSVLDQTGYGEEARPALKGRVRGNLQYLERDRKMVTKSGSGANVRWTLEASNELV